MPLVSDSCLPQVRVEGGNNAETSQGFEGTPGEASHSRSLKELLLVSLSHYPQVFSISPSKAPEIAKALTLMADEMESAVPNLEAESCLRGLSR